MNTLSKIRWVATTGAKNIVEPFLDLERRVRTWFAPAQSQWFRVWVPYRLLDRFAVKQIYILITKQGQRSLKSLSYDICGQFHQPFTQMCQCIRGLAYFFYLCSMPYAKKAEYVNICTRAKAAHGINVDTIGLWCWQNIIKPLPFHRRQCDGRPSGELWGLK